MCRCCSFGFNSQPLSNEDLNKIYDNYVFSFPTKGIGNTAYEKAIGLVEKNIDRAAYVVEIGASDGYVTKSLWERGYKNIFGLDPNPRIADDFPVPVYRQYFTEKTEFEHPVNAFVLIHVLEHFAKPWEIIAAMSSKLDEGGFVVIEVPALDFSLHHQHLSFFSVPFLIKMGYEHKLQVVDHIFDNDITRIVFQKKREVETLYTAEMIEELERDAITKAENTRRKAELIKERLNTYLADCIGEKIYWWGSGATSAIGFLKILPEIQKKVDFVIVDGDVSRRGLVFTPADKEVCFVEDILSGQRIKNLVMASVLNNEMFRTMERIECEAQNIFVYDLPV